MVLDFLRFSVPESKNGFAMLLDFDKLVVDFCLVSINVCAFFTAVLEALVVLGGKMDLVLVRGLAVNVDI